MSALLDQCPDCRGTGYETRAEGPGYVSVYCETCDGAGEAEVLCLTCEGELREDGYCASCADWQIEVQGDPLLRKDAA
jgi:DnaJ-class molecular chaperone